MLVYNSFWNQIYHILHFLFAFWLIGIAFPNLLFPAGSRDRLEQFFMNLMKGLLLLITMVYILVLTKMYEVISVTVSLVVLSSIRKSRTRPLEDLQEDRLKWIRWTLDYFEGLIPIRGLMMNGYQKGKEVWNSGFGRLRGSVLPSLFGGLMLIIWSLTIYIRFYDAWNSAVPGTSDGNVTLAWMKYLDARILFHDGFYPAGFHMYLSLLLKFSDIDGIYVLKYAGPFNMFLLGLGLYLIVSRVTKNKIAGMAALLVFGLMGYVYSSGGDLSRQASTNSQEFSFVFVFPTLLFFIQYMQSGRKAALFAGASGIAVIGLVHEVAFVWVGLGMILLICIQTAMNRLNEFIRVLHISLSGVAALVIAVIPLLLSKLLKIEEHSSTATFATARVTGLPPNPVHPIDLVTVGVAGFLLLQALLKKGTKGDKLSEAFLSLFIGMTFIIYAFGHFTDNEAVNSRSPDIWELCIPLALGLGWNVMFGLLSKLRWKSYVELIAGSIALFCVLYWVPMKPIIPDKMEGEANVREYLRISSEFNPKTFMIISPRVQEYGIVLGKGIHMYLNTLLSDYDPTKTPLTKFGEDKHAPVPENIFIYYEKKVYGIDEKQLTEDRRKELDSYPQAYAELQDWLKKYSATHSGDEKLTVYYDDSDFTVYYLHRTDDKKELLNKIWG